MDGAVGQQRATRSAKVGVGECEPADLTELSRRNGDVFPLELVSKIIDGRKSVKGHGGVDMPAWGDAFAKSGGGLTEAEVKVRIHNLTHFLWSIQKSAG